MQTTKKAAWSRIASLLLCLCMVFTMVPSAFAATAEDDEDELVGANIQDGVILGYYGPGGDIVIPNTVTAIGGEAFKGNKKITSVTIPGSVSQIGYSAFEGCPNLEKVIFSDPKDGAQLTIRVSAFMDCPKLTECTIPAVAKYVTGNVFKGCSSMTEIKVDLDNPYYFTKDGVLFGPWVEDGEPQYEDPNLALIAYPSGNPATSYTIPETVNGKPVNQLWASSFRKAANLTHVEIPATCVKLGGNAFEETGLTDITIPATVTSVGSGLFENCTSLTDVTFLNRLDVVEYCLFLGCTSLQRVNFTGGGPTTVDTYGFQNCTSLTNLILPEGVISIKAGAFDGCSNLQRVFIPSSVINFPSYESDFFNPFPDSPGNLIVYVVKGSNGEKWAVNHADEFGWAYQVVSGVDAMATTDVGTYTLVDMGNKVKLDGAYQMGTTLRMTPVTSGAVYNAFKAEAGDGALAVYQLNLEPNTATVPDSMDLKIGVPSSMSKNTKLYTYNDGKVSAVTSAYVSGTISASVEELGYYAVIDSTTQAVENPTVPTGIQLSSTSTSLEAGKRLQLTATVTPDSATDKTVTWSSDNTKVATVSKGIVTGVAAGSATITAETANGLKATCRVTVTGGSTPVDPTPAAEISAECAAIRVGNRNSEGKATFALSLTDPARISAVQVWFETDGTEISLTGQNGFVQVGDLNTTQVNGKTAYTAVLSYLNGAQSTLSASGVQNVLQIAVAGDKPTVTITDLKIAGWTVDGDSSTVAYGVIRNGIDPSQATYTDDKSYDINGDGKVDLLDITAAQLYYRATQGDSNWTDASRCDFNGDNVIDVEDFVEIWLHFDA